MVMVTPPEETSNKNYDPAFAPEEGEAEEIVYNKKVSDLAATQNKPPMIMVTTPDEVSNQIYNPAFVPAETEENQIIYNTESNADRPKNHPPPPPPTENVNTNYQPSLRPSSFTSDLYDVESMKNDFDVPYHVEYDPAASYNANYESSLQPENRTDDENELYNEPDSDDELNSQYRTINSLNRSQRSEQNENQNYDSQVGLSPATRF